ncbi:hypothetical protein B4100_0513 [Heyndrickxia coagulans]|nr:hypothetical protein B4100_0513 [Heyndrickxia coagulans]
MQQLAFFALNSHVSVLLPLFATPSAIEKNGKINVDAGLDRKSISLEKILMVIVL